MCIICVDFQQRRLTVREADRALGEMRDTLGDHAEEVARALRLAILDANGRKIGSLAETEGEDAR